MAVKLFPPGPKSVLPKGYSHVVNLIRDPLKFLTGLSAYGDIAYYKAGGFNVFVLNNPEYIKEILVTQQRKFIKAPSMKVLKKLVGEGLLTSEGSFHLRQRRLAQPAFHRKRIAEYAAIMTDYSARLQTGWQEGQVRDISEDMRYLTLPIATKTLFDSDVETEDKELREALDSLNGWAERVLLPFFVAEFLNKIPLPATLRFRKARAYFDRKLYDMIGDRRASGEDRGDLLSMLIKAQDVEGDHGSMTDTQIRDEVLTFFMAGHETTSLALSWTWYLLSQNPEVEAKLHAELDLVLAGRAPVLEDLPNLRFTEMVFTEAMRLFPPAYATSRMAAEDCIIGSYKIPKGSILIISQYAVQRNSRFFPEPEKFDPERWTPEAKAKIPKFAYFPFGGGIRLCIGEPFAWMEGTLLIADIARNWKLRLVPGRPVVPQPLITLRLKYGLKMRLERRHSPDLKQSSFQTAASVSIN